MFTRFTSMLSAIALSAPAIGQPETGQRVEIEMSSFKYTPSTITLKHGQSYVLHVVNRSDGSHDLVAKAFFAAAQVAPEDRGLIGKGEVELQGGAAVDIRLTAPAPGRYEVHCSHFMHSTFGMKAEIVVI